jgi:hypothetical protein
MVRADILRFRVALATMTELAPHVGAGGEMWRERMIADERCEPLPLRPEKFGPFISGRSVRVHRHLFASALVALGRLEAAVRDESPEGGAPNFEPLLNALVDAHYRASRAALRVPASRGAGQTA